MRSTTSEPPFDTVTDLSRSAQTSPLPHPPPLALSAKMEPALEQPITLASSPMLTVQAQSSMLAVQDQLVKPVLSES